MTHLPICFHNNCFCLQGRPATLTDCRVFATGDDGGKAGSSTNNTITKAGSETGLNVRVSCREGFDGGLPQTFLLEVYEMDELKTKVTNQQPDFEIAGFNANGHVKMFVFAQNGKGSSEPFILEEDALLNIGTKQTKHAPEGRRKLSTIRYSCFKWETGSTQLRKRL